MIILFTVLILLVILVNGWTDAPNAIAGCISTRAMSPKGALALAALCNLLGAVGMALISPQVALTLYGIADFGTDPRSGVAALCAGLSAVVIWAVAAWRLGLPTSESHALISALTGAAIAKSGSLSAVSSKEWRLVLLGLLITTLPPFVLGFLINKLLYILLKNKDRRSTVKYFLRAERLGAAMSALLHGAQDSQKFMGIYMLGISLLGGSYRQGEPIPIYIILLCALVMTLGTCLGGARIIKKVGCEMTKLDAVGGSSADCASSIVLFACSLLGIPASTTHSKASAMLGTGLCKRRGINLSVAGELFAAWGLTFPCCGALGFLISLLVSSIFT